MWDIPIKFHWTLIPTILVPTYMLGFTGLILIVALQISLLIHELAHAFVARHYNAKTEMITLHCFGGGAYIHVDHLSSWQRMKVAAAGPVSNIIIAALLFALTLVLPAPVLGMSMGLNVVWVIHNLMGLNFMLAAFNLLPILPLDGGIVLRSVLESRYGQAAATKLARRTSIIASISMILCSLVWFQTWTIMASLIMVLVFVQAMSLEPEQQIKN
jgi:Zn-dependent protease